MMKKADIIMVSIVSIGKKSNWKDQLSGVSCRNNLRQLPRIFLFFSKSICPRSMWSSLRLTRSKQGTAICPSKIRIFSSSICNQIMRRTKFWNPMMLFCIYFILSIVFWSWYGYNSTAETFNSLSKLLISFGSRV